MKLTEKGKKQFRVDDTNVTFVEEKRLGKWKLYINDKQAAYLLTIAENAQDVFALWNLGLIENE